MAVIEKWFAQDLQKLVPVRHVDGSLFSNNGNGNLIGVELYNNGEPLESITGTVSGYVVVSDGSTVPCTGSKSGNKASILIPAAAYLPGNAFVTIFITDNDTVTTVAAIQTTVIRTRTGTQVDPGSVVDDWTDTINAAMQEVETAAENLGGIIATPYASLTYPVPLGKYTYYNDGLYRCISPISTSEEWTAAHWIAVKLGDDVSELKSAIDYNDKLVSSKGLCDRDDALESDVFGITNTYCEMANGTMPNPDNTNAIYTSTYIPCEKGDIVTIHPLRPNLSGYIYKYGYQVYNSSKADTTQGTGAPTADNQTVTITVTGAAYIRFSIFESNNVVANPLRIASFNYAVYVSVKHGATLKNIVQNGFSDMREIVCYNLIGNQKNTLYPVYIPKKAKITFGTADGENASAEFTLRLRKQDNTQIDYFTLSSGAKTRTLTLNLSYDVYGVTYESTSDQGLQLVIGSTIETSQPYFGSKYSVDKYLAERKANVKLLEKISGNTFQRFDIVSDLEVGTFSSGQPDTSNVRLRSSAYHELTNSPIIFKFYDTTYTIAVEEYTSAKAFIKESSWLDNSSAVTYTPSSNCKYIKVLAKKVSSDMNFNVFGIPAVIGITAEYQDKTISQITLAGIEIDKTNNTVTASALRSALGIDSSSVSKIKVMSFNVGLYTEGINRDWTSADDAGIMKMRQILSQENCDILGLTEIRPTIGNSTESALIYNYLYPNKSESSYLGAMGIFSRLQMSNTGTGAWTDGRGYRYTTLSIGGAEVFFLLLHLNPDWTGKRETEISEVLSLLAEHDTFIACGDFNAGNLHSDWRSEYAGYLNAGYHLANAGYLGDMVTFPDNNSYLDNIITSSNIIICNSYVPTITDNPSDHLPIIAELMIT